MPVDLFQFRPNPYMLAINFNMYEVWPAAYRAVLNVLLACAGREVNGNNDLLAAGFTEVGGLVVHRNMLSTQIA
jgi:hypothetical protein